MLVENPQFQKGSKKVKPTKIKIIPLQKILQWFGHKTNGSSGFERISWDIIWKSQGGIMVNGFPREVRGTSQGTPFTMIAHILFHIMSLFLSSQTSIQGFLSANGLSSKYHWKYTGQEAEHIVRVKSHYTSLWCKKNEESDQT